jgi:hypothetical protein
MCPRRMWALAVALVGCQVPVQYGGPIPVDSVGVGGRLTLLCRAGMGGRTQAGCVEEESDAGDAGEDESAATGLR